MTEQEIANEAIFKLKQIDGLDIHSPFRIGAGGDELLSLDVVINGIRFNYEIKPLINKSNYNSIIQELQLTKRQQAQKPVLIIAGKIEGPIFDKLKDDKVNYVDAAGNCRIVENPLFIFISGQKGPKVKETACRAFGEIGIKLIYYFLLDDKNVAKSYREINKESGISLGSITKVVEELTKLKYIINTPNGRILKNRKQLLSDWQMAYNKILKPKLLIKEFDFIDEAALAGWNNIQLPVDMYWGGEPAAYQLNGFMYPEEFDIYSGVPSIYLLETKKVKAKSGGPIKVYQRFWNNSEVDNIPKFLIYADLMGSGNSRCIEAAEKLFENGI